ncbi:hypothetical protein MHU86_25683 [Fragilaria crotonensis]|nr:hypothetical protein MHU86_25683 [Fragilaria crotonensis]
MFKGKGCSRDYFVQGLIANNPSPPVVQTTTKSLRNSTARDHIGKGFSRNNYVQGLIVQKPSTPDARAATKSLRQSNKRDPVGGKKSTTTSRDASISRTDESSSQAMAKLAGSKVISVDSKHSTTPTTTAATTTTTTTPTIETTACNSFDLESENPANSPPPPVVQVHIHHDYENNHDHDDTIDDQQEESASDILRRKKLEALEDERRKLDQAIQDLRIAGEGIGEDDTITLGSRESTVISVPSTPFTSPVTNVEARVTTTNSVKSNEDITTQDVSNIEWTIAAPHRRKGRYTGTALNGNIPHGTGFLVFDDEEVYKGPFKYGLMQGSNGVLISASGATYEGEFLRNLRHGYGEEVFACGSSYVGKYEKGLPHGYGERRNPDDTLFFVGQWVKGKPAGREDNRLVDDKNDDLAVASSVDSDECLICLEGFSQDNPRIPTLCGCGTNRTYLHLPCLYQWKEQSQECPVCRQLITWEEL